MSSKQPRILMVLDAMLIGGTETHVATLAKSLLNKGIHVSICAGTGDLKPTFTALGCPIHVIPFFDAYSLQKKKQLRAQISRIIRQERITHMHIHQSHSGEIAFPVALQHHLATVITVHGKYYNRIRLRTMNRQGARIVAVSPPVRKWLKEQRVTSQTIPNGISLRTFYPKRMGLDAVRKSIGISSKEKVVLYVGRLAWEKADVCIRVIDACAQARGKDVKDLKLVIVGGGGHSETVKKHARAIQKRMSTQFISFLGTRLHLRGLYAMSDVTVGTGRVALEAMACAKPVVAIGSAGVFGRIQPGRLDAAWHYYFGDHAAPYPHDTSRLQEDIRRVLSSDSRQRRYGEAGRSFVVKRFNSDVVVNRMIHLYGHTHSLHR